MSLEHSPSRQAGPLRKYLSRKEAAEYLGVISAPTLAKYAVNGGGPRFYKLSSKVGYTIEDLDAWAQARTSTSDSGPKADADESDGA